MPNQNTITTTINIEGNITNLEKAVNEAQKSLNGLQLNKGMKESNAQMFADFKATFERMRELTEGGKLKAVDAKAFEKETEKFGKLWEKLVRITNSESLAEKPLQKYQTAIDNLKRAQTELGEKTKAAADKSKKALREQINAVEKLEKATKARENAETRRATADANKQRATQTKDDLYDKVFTKKGMQRKAASLEDVQAYQNAVKDIEQYNREVNDLDKSLTGLREKENQAKQAVNDANNAVETASTELQKLSKSELQPIIQRLQALNINWKDLGVNLKAINSSGDLEELQRKLQQKGLTEAAQSVAQFASGIKDATPAVNSFNKETGKAVKTITELTEKQQDIQRLADRVKYFFSLSSGAMLFRRVLRQTVQTITELDKVMTQTAVVTQMTVGDMWKMLPQYTERANQLGVAIKDVYEADTLYYQQGLKTNEVMAVSNETMKMARIAGLDAAEATDRMTNALRGFNMEITTANAQNINDVYSNLAAHTASNVQEISVAMTKVASLANSANMSFENTAAFLSQIIETTRESAETAGTALKTVIARFSEVKTLYSKGELMGQDEEGQEIDVNRISGALRTAGIDLNEYITGVKGLDEIFMELSAKWDSLDMVQQRYIATMAAGSRQQSRFIALMQDYNRMTELTTMANNSAGASTEQFSKTLESLETLTNRLKNAWNEFLLGLLNTDLVKGIIKLLTDLLNTVNKLTNGFDSGSKSFLKLVAAIGTFKIGGALFKGLTNSIVKAMGIAGDKGGKTFGAAFTNSINKVKSIKTFWVGLKPPADTLRKVQNVTAAESALTATMRNKDGTYNKSRTAVKRYIAALQELGFTETEGIAIQKAQNELGEKSLTETELAILLSDAETKSTIKQAVADGSLTGAKLKEIATDKIGNNVRSKGIFSRLAEFGAAIKQAFAVTFSSKAHKTETKESKKLTTQNYLEGASWYAKLGPIGLVVLAITAAVAIMAVLIIRIIALIRNGDKYDKQLKVLDQRLQEFNELQQEASANVNTLQDGLDKYSELQDKLDGLVEGTQEWNQALIESNQQVLDLLTNFPSLAEYVHTSGGRLTIDKSGIENLIKQQQTAALTASLGSAKTRAEIAEVQRQQAVDIGFDSIYMDRTVGQYILGGTLGLGKGLIGAAVLETQQREDFQKFIMAVSENEGELEDLVEIWPQYKDAINEHKGEILSLASQSKKVEAAQKAYESALITAATTASGAIGDTAAMISKSLENVDYDLLSQRASAFASGMSDTELRKKFVEAAGSDNYRVGTSGELEKKNDSGEWETFKLKDHRDFIRETIAESFTKAAADTKGRADRFGIEAYLRKNPRADQKQLERLLSSANNWAQEDLEYLKKEFGTYEDFLKTLGQIYDKTDADFIQNVDIVTGNWSDTIDVLTNKLQALLPENYNIPDIIKGMNPKGYSSLVKNLEKVSDLYGQDIVIQIVDFISTFKNLPKETSQLLLSMVQTLDFTSQDWYTQLVSAASGSGIDVSSDAWKTFRANAEELADVLGIDLNQALNANKDSVKSLIEYYNALTAGQKNKNLTEEEYQNYLQAALATGKTREEFNRYFQQTANGYTFLGSTKGAEQFYNEIIGNIIANAEKGAFGIDTNASRSKTIQNAQKEAEDFKNNIDFTGYYNEWTWGSKTSEEFSEEFIRALVEYLLQQGKEINVANIVEAAANQGVELHTNDAYGGIRTYNEVTGESTYAFTNARTQNQAGAVAVIAQQYADYMQLEQNAQGLKDSNLTLEEMSNALDQIELQYANIDQLIALYTEYAERFPDFGKKVIDYLNGVVEESEVLSGYGEQLTNEAVTWENKLEIINKLLKEQREKELTGNLTQWKKITDQLKEIDEGSEEWNDLIVTLSRETGLAEDDLRDRWQDFISLVEGDVSYLKDFQLLWTIQLGLDMTNFEEGMWTSENATQGLIDKFEEAKKSGVFDTYVERVYLQRNTKYLREGTNGKLIEDQADESGWYDIVKLKRSSESSFVKSSNAAGNSNKSNKSGETHNWLTSLDKYYNLTAAINEQLRKREKMEREYDRLLERRQYSMKDIHKNMLDQQASLRREIELQKQLQDGRYEQLKNAAGEKIQWKEGYSTYAAVGAANYAHWDEQNHQVVINWDAIHAITDEDLGGAVEAYISKLEEYEKGWEETESTIAEMDDKLYEINQRGKEEYLELEERVKNALVQQRQLEIDELQNISDKMNEMNSDIISNIQESIELERQIRDNTKKEEEISDLENRLEYLRRDTSGANQVAILETQEKLEEARQQYTDSLIDQTINQMQDDNEKAQEQREKQIELMNDSLKWDEDHGKFNEETRKLILESIDENGNLNDKSPLIELLKTTDSFKFLSEWSQFNWLTEMLEGWKKAMVGERSFQLEAAERNGAVAAENIKNFNQNLKLKDGKWYGDYGKQYSLDYDTISKMYTVAAVDDRKNIKTNKIEDTYVDPGSKTGNDNNTFTSTKQTPAKGEGNYGKWNIFSSHGQPLKLGVEGDKNQIEKQFTESLINMSLQAQLAAKATDSREVSTRTGTIKQELINLWGIKAETWGLKQIQNWLKNADQIKVQKYATGGLNTSTGPAWLDGTASKPEYVLNARDTQVYLTLTNLLNKLLSNSSSVSDSTSSGGDNYFNIDINVDELGSDYDVDQLMERIKSQIVDDAMYRNVNVINLHR